MDLLNSDVCQETNLGGGHAVAAVWYDGSWKLVDCDVAADTRPISFDYFMKDGFSYFELGKGYNLKDKDYSQLQKEKYRETLK